MCILPLAAPPNSPAALMDAAARQQLARDALRGVPIAHLAAQHHVSRKFVYQQRDRAEQGLAFAFNPPDEPDGLLFWLPVTKLWLQQLVRGLVLTCHSSYRGVRELLADQFDHPLAIGTVHNILHQAVAQAETINQQQKLSAVRIGAHDEIFPAGQPVLVGAEVRSSFCYLLSQEDQRDADTWGVRLLELQPRGFAPEATIADFGAGLRAGQKLVCPTLPCRADLVHPLRDFQALSTYLDNRAYDALAARDDLLRKQARHRRQHLRTDRSLALKAAVASRACEQAVALADAVGLLLHWWHHDILALAGDEYATRCRLSDWVVAELRARASCCEHRLRPVRVLLENHRDELLAFAEQLDTDLAQLAQRFAVSPAVVREALVCHQLDENWPSRWRREQALWRRLGGKYADLRVAVAQLARSVVRASSVIENLNSRLRNYFFLRQHLGNGYLKLLQFYRNHRRFPRSERAEREGTSPRELLRGQPHGHWLELLGYQRFRPAA